MNALICIGCNKYTHLHALEGAEKDAKEIFEVLSQQGGFYNRDLSRLLLSPATHLIIESLNQVFPRGTEIDVFTFFFAGHAGVKSGSFYLCVRDSEPERLSTTSFPISLLFSMVNEFRPRQVNIVVDGCEAGGSSFDLAQLSKPEVIGHSQASSITFLGACTSDQEAGETRWGGILTRQVLKCLTGECEINTKSRFLDLIEVGAVVCRTVLTDYPQQKPISWGLSLFGNGRFAQNPHFNSESNERSFPAGTVLPTSKMGKCIRANSTALWDEYRIIKEDPNPRRLHDLLESVFRDVSDDIGGMISSLQGLSRTLSERSRQSSELLAPSQCLAACAVSVLPHIDSNVAKGYVIDTLRHIILSDFNVWGDLVASLKSEEYALLSKATVTADLYYLPMRITRILGWIGWEIIAEFLIPELEDRNDQLRLSLVSMLLERYGASFVAVSEEQAPSLYLFITACILKEKRDLAENVINRYFASFAERRGNVNRAGTDGAQAYRYILSLGPDEFRPQDWRPANPSHLLPILLLGGVRLDLGSVWNLRALDRLFSSFFVPKSYLDFGRKVIDQGTNYTQQIGFNLWSLKDFKREFDRAIEESFSKETRDFAREGIALCMLCSLLYPDRVPLLLECSLSRHDY